MKRRAKHVEVLVATIPDAGSIPAASTIPPGFRPAIFICGIVLA